MEILNKMNTFPLFSRLGESLATHSESNAFCIEDRFYTYGDLRKEIASVQRILQTHRDKIVSKRVAIVCTNDFRTYASLLAIWLSGYAYVPLGLHNPIERNLSILKEANVNVIISTDPLNNESYSDFIVVHLPLLSEGPENVQVPDVTGDDFAYILFTSGSTGVPKGVPISFDNLLAFVESFEASDFVISASDRCLQMFELTFDVSISSFLMPLLKGACVYTVPNTGIKYMNVLKILQQYQLTSVQIVPSIIRLGKPLLSRMSLPAIKNCILTGEATSIDLLPEWVRVAPNAQIFNFYGPTEATIYCSFFRYEPSKLKNYNGMLAIGNAFKNVRLMIVDEEFKSVKPGQKGELLIGGRQITAGYLNLTEKNRVSFIKSSINGTEEVFYRSGDMCLEDEEGDLLYCGRFDNQVKVQGFRVELSEIEVNVRTRFSLNNVVIPVNNKNGNIELVLVLESKESEGASIQRYLKSKLPEYMVPVKVAALEEFPVTSSGKTDRVKIKELLNGKA